MDPLAGVVLIAIMLICGFRLGQIIFPDRVHLPSRGRKIPQSNTIVPIVWSSAIYSAKPSEDEFDIPTITRRRLYQQIEAGTQPQRYQLQRYGDSAKTLDTAAALTYKEAARQLTPAKVHADH